MAWTEKGHLLATATNVRVGYEATPNAAYENCEQHLKEKTHSFEDSNVHILDREDRWFERGVKEAIYVKIERPSLNGEGGL